MQAPAKRLPEAFDHISYSAISTFQTCPLRFYFRYVAGLPEKVISSNLVMGSALHRAVQHHFERLLIGDKTTDVDVLFDVFQEFWDSYADKTIAFGKGEDRNSLNQLAKKLLAAFLRSDFAQPKGVILAVEEELRGPIIPDCPEVLARVDLIVETANELIVSDFKTSRSSWSGFKVDDAAPQLLLYSELVKPMADAKPVKLAFAVLTKTKIPLLTIHNVPLSQNQLERTKRVADRVWRAIQQGNFYPNPSPMNCGSCPFRKPCRAWTG
jgi:putative RecB family exonuclease